MAEESALTEGQAEERRVFMALVNYATDQMIVEEVSVDEQVTDKKVQMMLRERGKNTLRVYLFSGDGQIDSSFNKDLHVNWAQLD